MHTPYRGLINPNSANDGGASLMVFEKYNHRIYLNKVKPCPLIHEKYMNMTHQQMRDSSCHQQSEEKRCTQFPTSTFYGKDARFFRRLKKDEDNLYQLLLQDPHNYARGKKYRDKDMSQFLLSLDKRNDPYGHKECKHQLVNLAKYRSKLWRQGKSYGSELDKLSLKEEYMFELFHKLEQKCKSEGQIINAQILTQIIEALVQELNIKSIDSLAKLFNRIQKPYDLSTKQIQQIYYNIQSVLYSQQQ